MAVPTRSRPARRAGYLLSVLVDAAMLYLLNVRPGWQSVPVLTADTSQVIGVVNLAVAAGLVANLVYVVRDEPWFKGLGDVLTLMVGLVAAVRVWQVFPFDLSSSPAWTLVVRVLLAVAVLGSAVGIVAALVTVVEDRRRRA